MFERHKWPTTQGIAVIILLVISIFSFAFLTENKLTLIPSGDKVTGMAIQENEVTGNMVRIG